MNGINRQYAISVISKSEEIYLILKQFSRELISLSQSDEYFLDRMSKKFCKYGTVLAVFDRQQNVVGFAAYYDNDLQNKTGFLSMIAVELSAQKKGVGTLLLDEVEKRILNSGMLRLNLEVHKSNLPAISFYGKHGYLCIEDADISWIYQKEF